METRLEIKPFEQKDGAKCIILQLIDIQLHATTMNPSSVGKNITKSLKTGQPGRIYSPLSKEVSVDKKLSILNIAQNDPMLLKTIQNYKRDGYKVLIQVPKEGLPIYAGKDMEEFIKSVKGERILRRIAKGKPIG